MLKNMNNYTSKGEFTSVILASLIGFSQVVFIENAISGFIILLAITIYSYKLGIISLLSSIVGTLIGKIGGAQENSVRSGLFGYNSVLTALAISLFLTGTSRWGIALLGAMIAAIFTATMMHFLKNIDMPVLTFPFIILTWFILLASYKLNVFHLSESLVPQSLSYWQLNIAGELNWAVGFLNNIEQIFFLNHPLSGVLLYTAIFWASWKLGLNAVIGSVVALVLSYGLGGEHALIIGGLYGYNAILTCMAVSTVFSTKSNRFRIISGILATCVTIPLTASFSTWLLPYGLPVLTIPFVLSTWLFLGARKVIPNL
ncbi:urea transporter [Lysinibacillus sp. FSL W8-0992]|uniref:urea transporter n=1 Tax=Lysinibacillus sp. FSL W8-0992 TaxID=2954643 RepID=UPI0030F94FDF